jgi:predicted metal-binding protein
MIASYIALVVQVSDVRKRAEKALHHNIVIVCAPCTDVYSEGDAELHENCRTVKTDLQQNHITYKILNKRIVNRPYL